MSIFFIFKTPPSTLPSVSLVYPSLHVSGSHTAKLFLAQILHNKSFPSMPRMPHPNNMNHAIYAVHCTVYTVQYSLPCSMCCPKKVCTDPPLLSAQHLCVPWFVVATDPKRHRNPVPIYHTFCHVKVKCLTELVRGQFVKTHYHLVDHKLFDFL